MLELMGRGYVIEHCIAALSRIRDEEAFRIYVSDALKVLSENTSRNGGSSMKVRYADIIDTSVPAQDDSRSCKEQVDDIWSRIRG